MCTIVKNRVQRVKKAVPNAFAILVPASQIIPERGTWVVAECHGDTIFRVAWTCPVCATTFYDHLGLDGKKIPKGQRRKVAECSKCLEVWEKARQDHYATHGYFQGRVRYAFCIPHPGQILLKDARGS